MRTAMTTLVALVVCSSLAAAQGTMETNRPRSVLQILNQHIPDVRFQETPFEQVMDWLAEFTGMNITVRWQTLEDYGVERDAPVSLRARNLTLSQVLWLIMNDVGGTDVKLAYRATSSMMILSTAADLGREMVTKIYDVSDLLHEVMQASPESNFDVTQGMGQGGGTGGGGGGGGGGMFGQGSQTGNQGQGQTGDQDGADTEALDRIIDLIEQTVEPDSWQTNGGTGTIIPFRRMLVVRNTILVHQRLGGYVSEDEVAGQ